MSQQPQQRTTHWADEMESAIIAKVEARVGWPAAMTVKLAAAYLDCTYSHVWQLMSNGHIPVADIGNKRTRGAPRLLRADLDKFLEKRKREGR